MHLVGNWINDNGFEITDVILIDLGFEIVLLNNVCYGGALVFLNY